MNKLVEAILDVYGQVGDFHITPFDGAISIFDADAQAEKVVKAYTDALLTEARADIAQLRRDHAAAVNEANIAKARLKGVTKQWHADRAALRDQSK
jgi:hypothetical protein